MLIDARFQDAADDGSLLDNPGLYHILTVWMKTSPDSIDRIKDWATTSVADRKGVAKFIGGFYRLVSITDSSGTSIYHQIEFNLMKQLIDPFSLEDVAKQMSGSQEITDHQRKALKDFSLDLELSRKKNRPLGDDSLRDT